MATHSQDAERARPARQKLADGDETAIIATGVTRPMRALARTHRLALACTR